MEDLDAERIRIQDWDTPYQYSMRLFFGFAALNAEGVARNKYTRAGRRGHRARHQRVVLDLLELGARD